MLIKRISTQEARANFSELLGSVYYTKNPVMVERKGKPFAVLISPEQYESLRGQQEKAWSVIEEIQARNRNYDPDEVLAQVTKAVEEVRQERHGKPQKKASKSSR